MLSNIKKFGLPVIVAINHFVADTENEMKALQEECNKIGVESVHVNIGQKAVREQLN